MIPSLTAARRIVVKIGSALIVDPATAAPRTEWLNSVTADIAALAARGAEVIVVSSGAISLARQKLNLTAAKLRLEEKQAAAAVGQIRLAQAWSDSLSGQNLTAAQLLLTLEDTEDRRRYLNARATLSTLLSLRCIPVINENDSVATTEIRFGDNDRLAARVAEMMQADSLILLSDIDGVYTADPRKNPAAAHIPIVEAMTPEIDACGGEPPPGYSSGGMKTKLIAAHIATQSGVAMAIALGNLQHPLAAIESGAKCTWFLPAPEGRGARKNWIAGHLAPQGARRAAPARRRRRPRPAQRLLPPPRRHQNRHRNLRTRRPRRYPNPRRNPHRPRPRRLLQHRRPNPRRPPLRRFRIPPRLPRPRRSRASRRFGIVLVRPRGLCPPGPPSKGSPLQSANKVLGREGSFATQAVE